MTKLAPSHLINLFAITLGANVTDIQSKCFPGMGCNFLAPFLANRWH